MTLHRSGSAVLVPVIVAALIFCAVSDGRAAPADDPVLARAYEVRFRPMSDAAEIVGPVLSDDGALTLKPRLNTLVVEDHVSVLDRVAALLESFDLPPRNVEVTLSLFLGTDRRADGDARRTASGVYSSEVRGVIEALGDFTKWTAYELLGSRSVTGAEGDRVVSNLSEEYRVVFTVDAVHDKKGVVDFERFSLQRVTRGDDDNETVEDLYTTGMLLDVGRLHVVGAASGPDSSRALFLTLQVEAR